MKQLDSFLHTLFWFAPGMFAGIALETYLDVQNHPGLYEMQSAPWYTKLLLHGAVCLTVMAAAWVLRRIIRKKALTIEYKNAEADDLFIGLCAIFIEYDCDC